MTDVSTPPAFAAPIQAQLPYQSGRYYFAPNASATSTAASLGVGTFRAMGWYVPNPITLSRIGAEVTVIGDAGSLYRLGIYRDTGLGDPDTLLLDAGTIAGDSATVQEITISTVLPAGFYWIGGVVQNVTVTQPTLRIVTQGGSVLPASGSNGQFGAGQVTMGTAFSGVAGALPATAPNPPLQPGNVPRIFVKVA